MSKEKKNHEMVTFVCSGNVCRSPMAESIFNTRVGPESGWQASSVGLFALDGSPASTQAIQALADWDIDLSEHRSRKLSEKLISDSRMIVVMTSQQRDELLQVFPEIQNRVFLLNDFDPSQNPLDVADPIGCSIEVYRSTRDEIEGAISNLLLHMVDEGLLKSPPKKKIHTMKIAIGADHGGFRARESIVQWLQEHEMDVIDFGVTNEESVDYPDYAMGVAQAVSDGEADQGVLVCTTGIGMSIAANKFPKVMAALCFTPEMAEYAKTHNNANVLTLSGKYCSEEDLSAILDSWFSHRFKAGGRHERRVNKIRALSSGIHDPAEVKDVDPEIYQTLIQEAARQRENLELIASENYASRAVREAMGSVLTNKYAEGYPGKRWYHGCRFVDEAERLAIERAKLIFGAEHVNVQPHSGSSANMAVFFAMLEPGDTILAMSLDQGGHLTHGHPVNFSGRFYNVIPYGVDKDTEMINYDKIEKLAKEHKPKIILAGFSAYSRVLDFGRFREIADEVGALLMADIAHIAGLVAAGYQPNPVPYCDFVTTTTHKTLRGPRGGLIMSREQYAKDVDRLVFPGIQGGPLMHVIAAKAVCLREVMEPSFRAYAAQVIINAQVLAATLDRVGARIVSGGTDNHLMLVDLKPLGITGKDAASALDEARITVNKNAIPFDDKSPFVTSGIRLGTPALTTRGMSEPEMVKIGELIYRVLSDLENNDVIKQVGKEVLELTQPFPVP